MMKPTLLILLLSVCFSPLNLYVQSGRKSPPKPATKPAEKTRPEKSEGEKTGDTESGISESRISPEGETVEGDVIRVDTALITVPVTVLDRSGKYVPRLR